MNFPGMKLRYRYILITVTFIILVLLWCRLSYLSKYDTNSPGFIPKQVDAIFYPAKKKYRKLTIAELARNKTHKKSDLRKLYKVNVILSDKLPLNRYIPDSRPLRCSGTQWPVDLQSTSVVITYHNEWPSILLRTIYSLLYKTPRKLLKQIILIDDASAETDFNDISKFIEEHLDSSIITHVRLPERHGLIQARLVGLAHVTSDVVVFLDSHMEVNIDWLQPLLMEIKKDRKTVAMGHLDYIDAKSLKYGYEEGYRTRYGFDWRMHFFETYFRNDQPSNGTSTLPAVIAVGSGFAVDVDYFHEIGTYDRGMKIWGGENIELSLRVWLCGGRMVHVACSKIGHIARDQPYSFLEDRSDVEMYNYKRTVDVWFDRYKEYVYDVYPDMRNMSVGDLSQRYALQRRLDCKPFRWFLKNVWPELFPYKQNVKAWGSLGVRKSSPMMCLDNANYVFSMATRLEVRPCTEDPSSQMFGLTTANQLRTILQCVTIQQEDLDYIPFLQSCFEIKETSTWTMKEGLFINLEKQLCLELMKNGLILNPCNANNTRQIWTFKTP